MKLFLQSLDSLPDSSLRGALTIGNFDGVHRGHRQLVTQLRQLADHVGGPAVVFTFHPSPSVLLRPETAPPALTWVQRRADLLHSIGVDVVLACPTTKELLGLEPEEFFHQVLRKRLDARGFAEGPNFHFGKNRRGDTRLLQHLALESQLLFSLVVPETFQGEIVSSTQIRKLLIDGQIETANQQLIEPYRLIGRVGRGAGRGRELGFPTANLQSIPVLVPAHGVYAGRAILDSKRLPAAIHIGPNPTFGEADSKVEVHILGLDRDLYDIELQVELLARLRTIERFESVTHLTKQLDLDIQRTREIVGQSIS